MEPSTACRLCANSDITIDTNVLSHAENIGCPEQESAFAVLEWLTECETVKWVLDDQGKKAPDPATSLLYAEYHATLGRQSFALQLLAQYLRMGRVHFAPRPGRADQLKLKELIHKNKKDRAVLGAAIGSNSKVLVSNDGDDFGDDVRATAQDHWGIQILHSDEAAA